MRGRRVRRQAARERRRARMAQARVAAREAAVERQRAIKQVTVAAVSTDVVGAGTNNNEDALPTPMKKRSKRKVLDVGVNQERERGSLRSSGTTRPRALRDSKHGTWEPPCPSGESVDALGAERDAAIIRQLESRLGVTGDVGKRHRKEQTIFASLGVDEKPVGGQEPDSSDDDGLGLGELINDVLGGIGPRRKPRK